MQRDEHEMLPLTLRHHARFFSPADMYVIDHASIRNIVPAGISRIFLPGARPYSEEARRDAVAAIASALLRYYDWGVYADCDELLDLDAFSPADLQRHPIVYVAGMAVARVGDGGNARLVGVLDPTMCKPLIFRKVPDWRLGFHGCSSTPQPQLSVPMAHLKYLDLETAAAIAGRRAAAYRAMDAAERQSGIARTWGGAGLSAPAFHQMVASLLRAGAPLEPFSPLASSAVLAAADGHFSAAPDVKAWPVDVTSNFHTALAPVEAPPGRAGMFKLFR